MTIQTHSPTREMFRAGARQALRYLFNEPPELSALEERRVAFPSTHDVSLWVPFHGDVQGRLVIGMPRPVALGMASALLMREVRAFDELARSALCEAANILAAQCTAQLAEVPIAMAIGLPSFAENRRLEVGFPALIFYEAAARLSFGSFSLAVGVAAPLAAAES